MKLFATVWLVIMIGALVAGCIVAACADQQRQVTDLREELRDQGDVRQARIEFGREAGFTDEDMRLIFGTKFHLQRLQYRLRGSLEALAVTLLDESEPTDVKAAAVQDYLAQREQILAQMSALQERLIQQVGAQDDPIKMGALIVFGVVDSGRRVLCAVNSEISGGGSGGIKLHERGQGLQQPLGN